MHIPDLDSVLFHVTRPARYTGGEWNSTVKDWGSTSIKVALAFPDTYEIGMSNLAIPILYKILNGQRDVLAERVFSPWMDMEAQLRQNDIPLYSLETRHALRDFDIIGFSLGYELTYTNVLNMLDLAGIPVLCRERDRSHPLVIAGGSCALNPETMADFIDIFILGEAEEALLHFLDVYRECRGDRKKLLEAACGVPGTYVPSLYSVEYDAEGRVRRLLPVLRGAPAKISRQVFEEGPQPVTDPVVPYIEVVHDRGAIEIQRGCSRGCRFCQAGMIYRPVRELPQDRVLQCAEELIQNCGYNEISLVSLSSGDYHDINGLVRRLSPLFQERHISLSLPSLRLDTSSIGLMEALPQKRKMTLTFAPEAGSERLRSAINKVISEDVILETFSHAFQKGWLNLKLYFMIGLPTETADDVAGIVELIKKIMQLGGQQYRSRPRLRVNVSTFVPKPHTPCQWLPQEGAESIIVKQEILKRGLRRLGVSLSWGDIGVSRLEAVLSRGDRRLGRVIHTAWKSGCKFDTWNEGFDFSKWLQAFKECGLEPGFYAHRSRDLQEVLPWSHIDTGVSSGFLLQEQRNIYEGRPTADCRTGECNACGLQRWSDGCRERCAG